MSSNAHVIRWPAMLLAVVMFTAGAAEVERHGFRHDRSQRFFLLHRSQHAQASRAARPLVLVIHGGGGTARGMLRNVGPSFHRLADTHGFHVVYPNAVDRMWDFGEGVVSARFERRRDDLGYFAKVIELASEQVRIDRERIFATGISRGGRASYFIACKLPGTLRAIAPFAMPLPDYLVDDCRRGEAVALAVFNGTEDPIVPYHGGTVRIGDGVERGQVLSTNDTIALWRRRNGCDAHDTTRTTRIDSARDDTHVERTEWTNCGTSPIVLYRIVNGGHTWPSGRQHLPKRWVGNVSQDIDGAEEVWRFFSRF